ncbi:MAG: diguanylate cyclase [Magnetococcales bacterium]|nr:diguanylate cyclase [Magnetococcales bacterium]
MSLDSGTNARVLIVDDEPGNIRILKEILGNDFQIFFATDGEKALEIASAERPDIVLLDIMMPGIDGFEVCRRLKAGPMTSAIPVIFVTASISEDDEAKGLEIGAIDYITKPLRPAIVNIRVRNHLELKKHRDMLEKLSTKDGLTGIANRRFFDTMLEQEWRRSSRSRSSLGLIMMDIDFFKQYNDHYGHLMGDRCLQQVAKRLEESMERSTDLIARYGGEEFVCLLPETDLEGLELIGQKLRQVIVESAIPHEVSQVADHITVSLGGVSLKPTQSGTPSDLIQLADEALYQAKSEGRNCLIIRAD